MNLEDLADLTADKLKALTDKELDDILSPYFNVTRPEIVQQNKPQLLKKVKPVSNISADRLKKLESLGEEGAELLELLGKKRR